MIKKDTRVTGNKLGALIVAIGRRERKIKKIKRRPRGRELVKFYGRKRERERGGRAKETILDNIRPFSLSNI